MLTRPPHNLDKIEHLLDPWLSSLCWNSLACWAASRFFKSSLLSHDVKLNSVIITQAFLALLLRANQPLSSALNLSALLPFCLADPLHALYSISPPLPWSDQKELLIKDSTCLIFATTSV